MMDRLALRCAGTKATSATRLALCVRRSGALDLSPLAGWACLMFFAHLFFDLGFAAGRLYACMSVLVRTGSNYNRAASVANLCTQLFDMLATMLRRAERKKVFVG